MSRTRQYSQDTLDIQARYFEVIQELLDAKKIPGGLIGFLTLHGIDSRHFYAQRKTPSRGFFEVSWLLPLIRYYKVSANWLLLGTGKKFRGQEGDSPS